MAKNQSTQKAYKKLDELKQKLLFHTYENQMEHVFIVIDQSMEKLREIEREESKKED